MDMDGFEQENPFDTDAGSTSRIAFSATPSPLANPAELPPAQSNGKSEFCCLRDQVLHSGDDVEVVVRSLLLFSPLN